MTGGTPASFEQKALLTRRVLQHTRGARSTPAFVVTVSLVVCSFIHGLARSSNLAQFGASLASLWVVFIGSVIAHEVGHLLGARAVKLRPIGLIAGGGPTIARVIAGIAVSVGLLPGNGLAVIVSERWQPLMKLRLLASYASGPAVSAALCIGSYSLFAEQWHDFVAAADRWLHPGPALVLVNALFLLTSIIPTAPAGDLGSVRNDLLQILALARMKPARLEALIMSDGAIDVTRHLILEDYEIALSKARDVLASTPASLNMRWQLATLTLIGRDYGAALLHHSLLRDDPALKAEGMPLYLSATVANNYAWSHYMLGEAGDLASAEAASREAIAVLPNNPSILGTRGAILVELGRTGEGRDLLERALKGTRNKSGRATNLAALSLLAAQLGNTREARSHLAQAERLDPDCELLPRAKAALARHEHGMLNVAPPA
jgi:tetratricopeptide (TPR) repeat protein